MNILVIGNGFDLAHGLPTKYSDFLNFVQHYILYKDSKISNNDKHFNYFKSIYNSNPLLYIEIEELIRNNLWIDYFQSILTERCNKGKDGWIDFESEISNIVQKLDEVRKGTAKQLEKGEGTVKINNQCSSRLNLIRLYTFNKYNADSIPKHKKKLLDDLNRLTRCLEIYLADYVSSMYNDCCYIAEIQELKINRVLSFNYTDTYQRLYDRDFHAEYDYIHGKAVLQNTIDECNLILGIDEYLDGDERRKDNEFIQFKKFYQRIYKRTGCKYIDWLTGTVEQRRMKDHVEIQPRSNVFIYGHSLDITDGDIIERLITNANITTTIFYHNKEALGNQIANLVKIIGEDKLIKMTEGSNASIVFQKLSPTPTIMSVTKTEIT